MGSPGRRRPTVGRRLLRRLKSAFQGAARRASAFADANGISRSAQAGRRPEAPGGRIHSAHMPTAGRRPSCRLKSAFLGACAPGVGLRRRKWDLPVGAGRPSAEGPLRSNSFGAYADRRPEAFMPIEIGLPRRLRAGRRPSPTQMGSPGRRRPVVGRRLLRRLKSAFQGAARRASAKADANGISRSAQADRRPKAVAPIEIGLPRRCAPGVGLRRRKWDLPVGAGRSSAGGPWRPNSFGAHADRRPEAFMPIEIGLLRRLRAGRRPSPTQMGSPGRRRPTVGRRPLEVEFIRRICRPPAGGLHAD